MRIHKARSIVVLASALVLASLAWANEPPASSSGTPSLVTRVERAITRGANAAASGVEHGVKAGAHGVEHGVKAGANGVQRGAKATERGVQKGANATSGAANKVATKMGASPPDSAP